MPLAYKDTNPAVTRAEYAVRGPIVDLADKLEKAGREIIYCNIGNPQSLGQKPITYVHQILSLCVYPDLAKTAPDAFPADVVEAAKTLLKASKHGLGAYSESRGIRFVREAVAKFIEKRDGVGVDADTIYLTDGASKGVQNILQILITGPKDGIMVPTPQYPLYSATISLFKGNIVPYFLDEKNGWKLDRSMLQAAWDKATANGIMIRGICVINPGNPTGSVLDAKNIAMTLSFAEEHGIPVLADEVYQDNVWGEGDAFVSFGKVLHDTGNRNVSLFSLHSVSKGFFGDCGFRGGYFVCQNVPDDVHEQILKLQSIGLCSNLPGQVAVYTLVRPPEPTEPSYDLYIKEKMEILASLKERALLLADGLNGIDGISCNLIKGALYAFPRITLPTGVTDNDYCIALLQETGICVVPGSGFGQEDGTNHFRITILPPKDQMQKVVERIAAFHKEFIKKHVRG